MISETELQQGQPGRCQRKSVATGLVTLWLAGTMWLTGTMWLCSATGARAQDATIPETPEQSHVPLLDNDAAWQHLPDCADAGANLPNWARALAASLPYTTAAVLELDGVYRRSPALDPKLRAKIRWTAARASRCTYGMAYGLADLRAAGASDREITTLRESQADLPASERAALAFAERMTTAAHSVTDAEVESLRAQFGEATLVAMVLQLAYANFMDRLVLALGVGVEEGGPVTPHVFSFPAFKSPGRIPEAPRPDSGAEADQSDLPRQSLEMQELFGRDWSEIQFDQLQFMLERQRARRGRVSVPSWEQVQRQLPPGMYPQDRDMKIRWSLVVLGHQPELGVAWLRCLRVFGREADFDAVLAESMFWVVTRSLNCFY